jgi:DNA-binding transcriptional LysR family regulator
MPDLRQLRTFVAVAEELNFTRAAAKLDMAQQAVSKSVRGLERELEVDLFERTTREVRLTPAGAALLESGRDALAAADAAFARARAIGQGLSGRVRVGASPAVGPVVLEQVVRVLREGASELSVEVLEVRPRDVARLLRDRAVDLVFARTFNGTPEVDSASLSPTPAALAASADHRLAASQAVALRDLDGERLLAWSPAGTPYTDMLVDRIAAAGARVELVESRVTGAAALTGLSEHGAVALVPVGWPRTEGVVQVPLTDDVTLPLLVLWPVGVPSVAVMRLRSALSTVA